VTLTIGSWCTDDLAIWPEKIIPAFEAAHPGIRARSTPSAPAEQNAALHSTLGAGSAGDLITCRPFDASLALFQTGHLVPLTDLPGMAKSAWITDGDTMSFCVPMASVIHGFICEREAFAELGLEPPTTLAECRAVLGRIREDGTCIPMAMGTNGQWEAATTGYPNIGPTCCKGEEGRLALIAGTRKLTDRPWVAPLRELATRGPCLCDGHAAQTFTESRIVGRVSRSGFALPEGCRGKHRFPGFQADLTGSRPDPAVIATCTDSRADHAVAATETGAPVLVAKARAMTAARPSSPAASPSAWPSAGPSCATPGWSCSTSRSRTSMRRSERPPGWRSPRCTAAPRPR
jgi:raffinose/stachyose/melibiose transport system substrate-binding protein